VKNTCRRLQKLEMKAVARIRKTTVKQLELLSYIKKFIKDNSYPPTRIEIAKHFVIYENAVQEMLVRLEVNGHIELVPKISRGIIIKEVVNEREGTESSD